MSSLLLAIIVIAFLRYITNIVYSISPFLAMILYMLGFFLIFYYPVIRSKKTYKNYSNTQNSNYSQTYEQDYQNNTTSSKIKPEDIVEATYSEKEVK